MITDYEKEYNKLLLDHIHLREKLKETTIKSIKHIEAYQHERSLRLKTDSLNSKLQNTIKCMKYLHRQKDAKIDGLLGTIYTQIKEDTTLNLEDIKIDIRV